MSVLTLVKLNKVVTPWQKTTWNVINQDMPRSLQPEVVFTTSTTNSVSRSRVQGSLPFYSDSYPGCDCNKSIQIPRFNVELLVPDAIDSASSVEDLFDTILDFLTTHKAEIISAAQSLD